MCASRAQGGSIISRADVAQQLLGLLAEMLEIGLSGKGAWRTTLLGERACRCPQRNAEGIMQRSNRGG